MPYNNTITNYATQCEAGIADVLRQEMLTGELETPAVKWLGARKFEERSIAVGGYQPHNRGGGWNRGAVSDGKTTYELAFDRDISLFMDYADVDETNYELTAGNVTAAFFRQQVIPETDAYRFSKMAAVAIGRNQTASETITPGNAYGVLKSALLPVRKYGASNILVYASSATMDSLERSTDFSRSVSTEKVGKIETRVTGVDGVRIVEVWDADRFKTLFDFSDGFAPTAGTLDINFLVAAKPAVIAKVKMASIYLKHPGQHDQGDGWLYESRLYHDLFVKESHADGVYVSTAAA